MYQFMNKQDKELRAKNLCKELGIDPFSINPTYKKEGWRVLLLILENERNLLKSEFRDFMGMSCDNKDEI